MKKAYPIVAVFAALLLGGCNPTTLSLAASPLFNESEHVNFLNANYAAADQLTMQARQRLPKGNTLVVSTLEEIVDRSGQKIITNPNLGAVMADHLEQRFIQLGYNVVKVGSPARGAVTGLYQPVGKRLSVRLRVTDTKTGTQLAVYDYWLPITSEIRRHMNPNSGGFPLYRMRESLDEMIDN